MAKSLGSQTSTGVKAPPQTSSPSHSAVGSGSRPGTSKVTIKDSSPMDPHKLGRAPADYLK